MKFLMTVLVALAGLSTAALAYADQPGCRNDPGNTQERCQDGSAAAKKPATRASRMPDGSGLTPADKEIMDRAATRSLLESIDSQVRRQRLGQ
jgi:hypothetical protein